MNRWSVYGLVSADSEIIYVGMSANVDARLVSHRNNQPWAHEIASHVTFADALDLRTAQCLEAQTIAEHRPCHNVQYNPDRRLDGKPVTVGFAIRSRRIRCGMNKVALAAAVGVDRSLITRLESGERNASPAMLLRLARALDCDAADLTEAAA